MKRCYSDKGFKRIFSSAPTVLAAIFATFTAIIPAPAFALFTFWTGAVSNDWNDPRNWSSGTVPGAGGSLDTTSVVMGNPNVSPVISSAVPTDYLLRIGDNVAGGPNNLVGSLTITGNGALTLTRYAAVGYSDNTNASLFVTGPNASLTINKINGLGFLYVALGNSSVGNLVISNGATVNALGTFDVAGGANSTGTVTVDHATLAIGDNSFIGDGGGNATVSIINGGTFISGYNQSSTTPDVIGFGAAKATVIVSGSGSSFTDYNSLVIGSNGGSGTLTLSDGSSTSVLHEIDIAEGATSTGTINIGSAANQNPVAPGRLITSAINIAAGTGDIVFNHTSFDYFFAPIITGGSANGSAVDVYNGTTVMTGASTYLGQTRVHGGTLAAGAANVFSPNSNYSVDPAGTLDLRSNNQTIPSLINAGTVRTGAQNGAPGTTLTTNNYVGFDGDLILNTYLSDDTSPSDKLVINGGSASGVAQAINGSATGVTKLFVNNILGPGAITEANGILVVDAINGGTTASGSFVQGGEIAAGPYEYTLYQGGLDGSNPNNWYLRSIIYDPADPPTPGLPPGFEPNYRPIVSLYTAIPSMAMLYDQLMFDSLHQRVGEEEQILCDPCLPRRPFVNGAWVRVIGENGERSNGGIFHSGPDFDYNFGAIQGGVDLYHQRYRNCHSDFAGIFGAIGRNNGHTKNALKVNSGNAGSDRFNAYTGGVYWTHFGPSGWYLDGIAQGTFDRIWSDNNLDDDELKTIGRDWGASLEGGYPFRLIHDFTIEPQAQISYQRLTINDAHVMGATIHFDNSRSTAGRAGAMLSKNWCIASRVFGPKTITGWVSANVWHQFDGGSTTSFSSAAGFIPFHSTIRGSWTDFGVGLSARVSKNGTVYASYNRDDIFEHGKGHSNEGSVGVRVNI